LLRLIGALLRLGLRLAVGAAALYAAWVGLQRAWCALFGGRKLTAEEIAASLEVHPVGAIPYDRICVSEGSPALKVNGNRAMATAHVIHAPVGGLDIPTMVHELSHVLQYQKVGPVMMVQALYGQLFGGGYNYGDLGQLRLTGKRFVHLNREQQAQVCEDYYRLRHGMVAWFSNRVEDLEPFVADMRRGEV